MGKFLEFGRSSRRGSHSLCSTNGVFKFVRPCFNFFLQLLRGVITAARNVFFLFSFSIVFFLLSFSIFQSPDLVWTLLRIFPCEFLQFEAGTLLLNSLVLAHPCLWYKTSTPMHKNNANIVSMIRSRVKKQTILF